MGRQGNAYWLSPEGQTWAARADRRPEGTRVKLQRVIGEYRVGQREVLRGHLHMLSPARFEAVIGDLLEAMGYTDVIVTRAAGDLGIDVRARIEMGITEVTEVVQVKRQTGSVQRPVLDRLRGVLPLHQAIKGTIITLGGFSRGSEDVATHQGAAPITLIDGEKLIDLLIRHNIGVSPWTEELFEVDETYLREDCGPLEPDAGPDI